MGVYVHFTDEQKYRANNVELADFLQRRGEKLLPSGRDKRLASDHSITVRGNEWYDHSAESGGYAIDFVRKFYGCSYPEAVTLLLGGEQSEIYRPAQAKKEEPKKPFALPPAHTDMRRVYAYLVKPGASAGRWSASLQSRNFSTKAAKNLRMGQRNTTTRCLWAWMKTVLPAMPTSAEFTPWGRRTKGM